MLEIPTRVSRRTYAEWIAATYHQPVEYALERLAEGDEFDLLFPLRISDHRFECRAVDSVGPPPDPVAEFDYLSYRFGNRELPFKR